MKYRYVAISEADVPRASMPLLQHLIDTYVSETNKLISVWLEFPENQLSFRPHARSRTVADIFKHELLSERHFFGGFLGLQEPEVSQAVPECRTVEEYAKVIEELARPRLEFLASQPEQWWLERVPFFDVTRERIWIFWRRVLHTAHHRTQLTFYLRMLERPVPQTYGPTADVR